MCEVSVDEWFTQQWYLFICLSFCVCVGEFGSIVNGQLTVEGDDEGGGSGGGHTKGVMMKLLTGTVQ